MKWVFLFLLPFSGTSYADVSPEGALKWTCTEFNKLGDIDDLRVYLRRDMRKLRRLVEDYDGQSDLRRIEPVIARLRVHLDRLNQIIGPKYSNPDYLQTKEWSLGPKRLWLGDGPVPYWKITGARVLRVYNWTLRQEELLVYAAHQVLPYHIDVQLRRPASLAELCQYEQTIMVTIEFDVEHKGRTKTLRRNLLTQPLGEQ